MHDTALVCSDVQLHPEVPVAPLRVCFISGSRIALAFLVELGAAIMVASTMVPERSNSRRSSSNPVIEAKIAWVSPCCSSRWRKRRIVALVRHHLVAQLDADKAPHRLAVVLEGRRSQVSPGVGNALPDQSASHLPAAVERALANDQPGALADPSAR